MSENMNGGEREALLGQAWEAALVRYPGDGGLTHNYRGAFIVGWSSCLDAALAARPAPVFCPGGITDTASHRAACDHHARQARPPECCGVCPPILRGGYDCTCADNPRCPGPRPAPGAAEYVRNGVCLLCGGAVLNSGKHIDPDRHTAEVERITSGRPAPVVSGEADRCGACGSPINGFMQCAEDDPALADDHTDMTQVRYTVERHGTDEQKATLGITVADEGRAEA